MLEFANKDLKKLEKEHGKRFLKYTIDKIILFGGLPQ